MPLLINPSVSELDNLAALMNRTFSNTGLIFNTVDYNYKVRNERSLTGNSTLIVTAKDTNNFAWNFSHELPFDRVDLNKLHEKHVIDSDVNFKVVSGAVPENDLQKIANMFGIIKSSISAKWVGKEFMPGLGNVYKAKLYTSDDWAEGTLCYIGDAVLWFYDSMVDLSVVTGPLAGFLNFAGLGKQSFKPAQTTEVLNPQMTDKENAFEIAKVVFGKTLNPNTHQASYVDGRLHFLSADTDNHTFEYERMSLATLGSDVVNDGLIWYPDDTLETPEAVKTFLRVQYKLPKDKLEYEWLGQTVQDVEGSELTTTTITSQVKIKVPSYLPEGLLTVSFGEVVVTMTRVVLIKTYNLKANGTGQGLVNPAMIFGKTTPLKAKAFIYNNGQFMNPGPLKAPGVKRLQIP